MVRGKTEICHNSSERRQEWVRHSKAIGSGGLDVMIVCFPSLNLELREFEKSIRVKT